MSMRIGLEFRHTDIRGGGTFVYFLNLEKGLKALGLETSRIYHPQSVAKTGPRHYIDRAMALIERKRQIRRLGDRIDLFASPFPEWQHIKGVARSYHCQDVSFRRTGGFNPMLIRHWNRQIRHMLD